MNQRSDKLDTKKRVECNKCVSDSLVTGQDGSDEDSITPSEHVVITMENITQPYSVHTIKRKVIEFVKTPTVASLHNTIVRSMSVCVLYQFTE